VNQRVELTNDRGRKLNQRVELTNDRGLKIAIEVRVECRSGM